MPVYVFDAVRTPRGKARPDGGLAAIRPHELVGQLVDALDERAGAAREVDGLLLGCVGQIGAQGGHIALVSKLHAGVRDEACACTLNNYCVSSLTAIGQAMGLIAGGAGRVLAGGVEAMSRVPFMADAADYYTDAGFPARTRYVPVALAADRLAEAERIGREALDAVALTSQRRAAAAEQLAGLMRSRIPVRRAEGAVALERDECLRPKTDAQSLAALAPAFGELAASWREALGGERFEPRHTIAHAPPVCDGAALALLGADPRGAVRPRARILACAEAGGDPHAGLLAGFTAMRRALERAGLSLRDIERIEFMEAFGVTIAKFLRDFDVDPARVNVAGGHLARGHPMGASGAILLSSLLDALDEADATTGMVVASGASGVGAALVVERVAAGR